MVSIFKYLLVKRVNHTYEGLSSSKNPFGKLDLVYTGIYELVLGVYPDVIRDYL